MSPYPFSLGFILFVLALVCLHDFSLTFMIFIAETMGIGKYE